MRKLIFAGLTLSAVFIPSLRALADEGERPWCVVGDRRSMECVYWTRAQCAGDTSRLFGGGCFQNPFYHGPPEVPAGRAVRVRVDHVRHKSHHHTADH